MVGGGPSGWGWPFLFGFGVGPSFSRLQLALRGGVGFLGRGWPFLLGGGVGRPLSWAGVGPRGWPFSGCWVGPSFSGLGSALPVGLALRSLGWGFALP